MYIDRQIDRIVKGLKKHVSLKLVDFKIYKLSFFVLLQIQNKLQTNYKLRTKISSKWDQNYISKKLFLLCLRPIIGVRRTEGGWYGRTIPITSSFMTIYR